VERKTPGQVLGVDTETSMRSGAQEGAVFEMEGFVRYYQQDYEELQLILTGGDAAFFWKSSVYQGRCNAPGSCILWIKRNFLL
jgi:type III pantothenate kinase